MISRMHSFHFRSFIIEVNKFVDEIRTESSRTVRLVSVTWPSLCSLIGCTHRMRCHVDSRDPPRVIFCSPWTGWLIWRSRRVSKQTDGDLALRRDTKRAARCLVTPAYSFGKCMNSFRWRLIRWFSRLTWNRPITNPVKMLQTSIDVRNDVYWQQSADDIIHYTVWMIFICSLLHFYSLIITVSLITLH